MKSLKAFFSILCLSQNVIVDAAPSQCKCLYGQRCWPSTRDFEALSAQISQPLIHPLPPASPCYSSAPDQSSLCPDVQANFRNGTWRAGIPGAFQNINFETYIFPNDTISACYLNTTLGAPCGQGSVPPVGVDARTPEDIQAAVRFARRHDLKVVVKNTGHDYIGRSAGRGGFMIWTHHMKGIEVHDAFVEEGGRSSDGQEAMTLGAGVQWQEAYVAAATRNRFILGGVSADGSVGAAGGWLLGGGHNALSGKFGLGVDNVLQITLVNARGDHIVANRYRNRSLFWALRGGGGGTFGITTSVTYRTHPIVPLTAVFGTVNFTSPEAAQRGVSEYIRAHALLSDNEWGGYSFFTPFNLFFFYLAPNVSLPDANATITPLLDVLTEVGAPGAQFHLIPFESFYALGDAQLPGGGGGGVQESQVGSRVEISSRLLSRDAATNRSEDVARTLLSFGFAAINYVGGGAVNRVDPDSTGLHPGWRKALAQVYIAENWQDGDSPEVIRAAQTRLRENTLILDTISEDSAAYLNEATLHEADFRKAFWGSNYPRLKRIKDEVDPSGVFIVPRGVGSEEWDTEGVCRV